MKTTFLFLTAAVLFMASPVKAHTLRFLAPLITTLTDTSLQKQSDVQLLVQAYNNSVYEIKASKLAHRTTGSRKVKQFAKSIRISEEATNKDIAALLTIKGIAIPTAEPADLKARFKYLNEWMGKDFNLKYTAASIQSQRESIALYSFMSLSSKDGDIRHFAKGAVTQSQVQEDSAASLLKYINRPITSTW